MITNSRLNYIDNLKGVLIILVVFAHIIEFFLENTIFKYIYIIIYSFHMPLFIFISGYLSTKQTSKKVIKKLIVPYFIFQFLYCLFSIYVLKADTKINFTTPYWIMWYILALIIWNILIQYFNTNIFPDYRKALLITIIFGIVIGFDDSVSYYMSLSRVIVFFPFFLLGYSLRNKEIDISAIKNVPKLKIILTILTILILVLAYLKLDVTNLAWLYGSYPYNSLEYSCTHRILIYISATILSSSMLLLVPQRHFFLSKLGINSLSIFILHGFIIKYVQLKFNFFMLTTTSLKLSYVICMTILVVGVLSSNLLKKVLHFILYAIPTALYHTYNRINKPYF